MGKLGLGLVERFGDDGSVVKTSTKAKDVERETNKKERKKKKRHRLHQRKVKTLLGASVLFADTFTINLFCTIKPNTHTHTQCNATIPFTVHSLSHFSLLPPQFFTSPLIYVLNENVLFSSSQSYFLHELSHSNSL